MVTPIHIGQFARQLYTHAITRDISSIIAKFHHNPPKLFIPGTEALTFSREKEKIFFSVDKSLQEKMNFVEVRRGILSHLELPPHTKILQIIGDCIPFSATGTKKARDIIDSILDKPDQLLLWGYTGSKKDDGRKLDTNQLLNEWVDIDDERGKRALANVLDIDTPRALTEWNCLGAQTVKKFYLVRGGATFGEDIVSSDSITDKACCFDGGIQSFRQMMSLLMRDVNIECYYGLRDENKYISAVQFIKFIRDNIQQYYEYNGLRESKVPETMEIVNDFLELWKEDYLKVYPLYNPEVKDASSRQALFEAGWNLLLEKQLWKKLSLCQFSAI